MRAMKDSGIPWIGDVPKGWTIELIGNQVKSVDNPNTDGEECNALQFKMGTIISKSKGDSKYNPETLERYNIVDKGVIMLNGLNLSFDFISQRVGLVKERGVITSTYLAVKPTPNIDSEFLTYLFKAYDNCKAFHSMGRGLRQTLSYSELRKNLIVYPSLSEQQKIAEFLDRKCAEVDEMIGLQEQIIEELKAYKQSVITEAVTKGLNPNVPMKDSGIEWIGSIPEHWEQGRLKNYFHLHGRIGWNGLRSEEFQENSYAYLVTGQDFLVRNVDWNRCYQICKERYDEDEYIQLKNGDILVTKDGTIGKVAVVTNLDKPACLNSGIFVVKQFEPKRYNPDFIYWLFVSPILKTFNDFLNLGGTTIIHLYQNVFERMPMVLPPIEEQEHIAEYLNTKCTEIDNLISIKQSKIDSLKEYKKSIIYEYVTGKREVE